MKESLGDSTVELPDEIDVHWQDYDSHWDCTIKYISTYGAGFPRRWDGYKYCSIGERTKCTMPDGTELIMGDPGEFIGEVFNWFDRRDCRKVKLTDGEVEFMDI